MVIRLIFGSANIFLICENVGEMPKNDACQGMTGESLFTVCDSCLSQLYCKYAKTVCQAFYFVISFIFKRIMGEDKNALSQSLSKTKLPKHLFYLATSAALMLSVN